MNRVVLTQENGVPRKYVPAIGKNVYSIDGLSYVVKSSNEWDEKTKLGSEGVSSIISNKHIIYTGDSTVSSGMGYIFLFYLNAGTYNFGYKQSNGNQNCRLLSTEEFNGSIYNSYYGGYYTNFTGIYTFTIENKSKVGVYFNNGASPNDYIYDVFFSKTRTTYEPYFDPYIHSVTNVYDNNGTLVGTHDLRSVDTIKDTWNTDGSISRKLGMVDLGSLSWTKYTSGSNWLFYATIPNGKTNMFERKTYCMNSKYNDFGVGRGGRDTASGEDKIANWDGTNSQYLIKDLSYTDATTFKNSLNGVYLIYELATPTTEQVTPVSLGSGLSFNDGTNQLESRQKMYFQEGRFK